MHKKIYLATVMMIAALALTSCNEVLSEKNSATTGTTSEQSAVSADKEDLFTDRDLEQKPDTSDAETINVKDGEDVLIDKEGTYVLKGTASDMTVRIEAGDEDKVQLVLDGLVITNCDKPCIYVLNADKVFVSISSDSELSVTDAFTADGDTKTDGVII